MANKKKSIVGYCLIIVLSIAVFLYANVYRELSNFPGDPSSSFMPQLCAVIMLLLSLVMLISTIRSKDNTNVPPAVEKACEVNNSTPGRSDFYRGMGSILLLLFLVLTFDVLGFIISTIIYLFLQQLLLTTKGNRHWIRTTIVSLAVPAICYLVFVKALNYMLPMGLLR